MLAPQIRYATPPQRSASDRQEMRAFQRHNDWKHHNAWYASRLVGTEWRHCRERITDAERSGFIPNVGGERRTKQRHSCPAFSYMALFTPYGTTPGTSLASNFTLFIVFTIRSVAYPYPNLCRQQQTESDTNNYCDVYGDWGASRAFFTFRRMIPSSRVTQESQSVNQMNAGGTYILACAASNSEMEQALRFG